MRLERPHRVIAWAVVLVILPLAVLPRLGLVVVLLDPLVILAGDAADRRFVPGVGPAEPAGGESADVLARLDQHDRLAHARGLDRGGHAPGGATVNTHVKLGREGSWGKDEENEEIGRASCREREES